LCLWDSGRMKLLWSARRIFVDAKEREIAAAARGSSHSTAKRLPAASGSGRVAGRAVFTLQIFFANAGLGQKVGEDTHVPLGGKQLTRSKDHRIKCETEKAQREQRGSRRGGRRRRGGTAGTGGHFGETWEGPLGSGSW
jgi:hypothetical protein